MTENEISYQIRGAAFEVLNKMGPGLLESIYEAALMIEIKKKGMQVSKQVPMPVVYDEIDLGLGFRLDLLVENKVIVEIKSVESLHEVHFKQLLTYLKLTEKKLGLLINFNSVKLEDKKSIFRVVNNF